jgi:hypothetical protein
MKAPLMGLLKLTLLSPRRKRLGYAKVTLLAHCRLLIFLAHALDEE